MRAGICRSWSAGPGSISTRSPTAGRPRLPARTRAAGRAGSPGRGQNGYQALYAELPRLDPAAAEKIDPRNLRRTVRALEVIRLTGRKFSDQRRPGSRVPTAC